MRLAGESRMDTAMPHRKGWGSLRRKTWLVLVLLIVSGVLPVYRVCASVLPMGAVEGVVVGADDRPIEGVRVTLFQQTNEYTREILAETMTGPDGTYRFSLVPQGSYSISASWTAPPASDGPIVESTQIYHDVQVTNGVATSVTFNIGVPANEGRANVLIQIQNSQQKRQGELAIVLQGEDDVDYQFRIYRYRIGGQQGVISLRIHAGKYRVHVTASDYDRRVSFYGLTLNVGQDHDAVTTLEVPPRQGDGAVHVSMTPYSNAFHVREVSLIDLDGEPIQTISPYDFPRTTPAMEFVGLSDGTYVLEYTFDVRSVVGAGVVRAWQPVRVESEGIVDVEIPQLLTPAVVTATVVDGAGKPIPGPQVEVEQLVQIDERMKLYRSVPWPVDEIGRMRVLVLPGKHQFRIRSGSYESTVTVEAEANSVVDLGILRLGPEPEPEPSPQPTPPSGGGMPQPPFVPAPQPRDVTVLDPSQLEQQLKTPGSGVNVDVPLGHAVAVPASVSDMLAKAGKTEMALKYGSVELSVPVKNLDVQELAAANPQLKELLDKPDLQLVFKVESSRPSSLPSGMVSAGSLYEITLSAVAAGAEPLPIQRLAEPVRLTVPISWTGDPALVGLWYQQDDRTLVPVPSWPGSGGTLEAALRHFSTYVVAVRRPAFRDLDGYWARSAIEAAYAHGIVNGIDQAGTTFLPEREVNRAEFTAMLVRALGLEPDAAGAAQFRDVGKSWYAGAVGAAYKAGIVRGVTASQFEPGRSLTRLELAAMIGRALKAHGYVATKSASEILGRFCDAASVPAWARDEVAVAVDAGVVRGVTNDTLGLSRTATRAQAATMVVRILQAWLGSDGSLRVSGEAAHR